MSFIGDCLRNSWISVPRLRTLTCFHRHREIRAQAGLLPHTEVEFVIDGEGVADRAQVCGGGANPLT